MKETKEPDTFLVIADEDGPTVTYEQHLGWFEKVPEHVQERIFAQNRRLAEALRKAMKAPTEPEKPAA